MSRYVHRTKGYIVYVGYDRPLNYVFLDIEEVNAKNDEFVFDCLEEKSPFLIKDLSYYEPILEKMGIKLPQELINKVHTDRDEQQGRR